MSDVLLESLFRDTPAVASMLTAIQCIRSFNSSSPDVVHTLIEDIDDELFVNNPEKRMMLQACLQRLFLVIYRLWNGAEVRNIGANALSLQYFQKFQQYIRQAGSKTTIAQIAKDIGISSVHLNRICRATAGKSGSQILQEHILDEARKYLSYTSYTISEIAYLLHFEYPNYFAKFFKKNTGMTPSDFRVNAKKMM